MDADPYQHWPAVAHILGHLYNYDLCALAKLQDKQVASTCSSLLHTLKSSGLSADCRRPDARFVWKRLPDSLKQVRSIARAFSDRDGLVQALVLTHSAGFIFIAGQGGGSGGPAAAGDVEQGLPGTLCTAWSCARGTVFDGTAFLLYSCQHCPIGISSIGPAPPLSEFPAVQSSPS